MGTAMRTDELWWRAPKDKVNPAVFNCVRKIEQEHGQVFDRFVKLERLYDPNTPDGSGDVGQVTENVIATGVDTISAIFATVDIRARFLTDGADWAQLRRARHLEFYAEEQATEHKVLQKCRRAAREALKKGNGITKASVRFGKPRVELVAVENMVVDPWECRDGRDPTHMHQWDFVDVEELSARFPKKAAEIEQARGRNSDWGKVAGRYVMPTHQVAVLYSWRNPIGVKGEEGYRPGRETLCIDGCDLLDEPFHDECPPFGVMVWSERVKSWYGISGVERLMGLQRALNKRTWAIETSIDHNANLWTFIRPADAKFATMSNKAGNFAIMKGELPQRPVLPAVHPDIVNSRAALRVAALEEIGVNQMAAHASKPAGVDSGAAIREFTDATTQRHATQEVAFEQLVLDTIWNLLMQCRKLGAKAPKMIRRGRFGARHIAWKDVDPREAKIQMRAASNTTRQPWGRTQTALELAQAGLISMDSARRMLKHLDIDQELSLYMAALESIEGDLDDMADGQISIPEPFTNLDMAVWRGQNEYLKWTREGAPEEVLEVLRQYVVLAAHKLSLASPANANMPADPMASAMPSSAQPTAALAPEAMQLQAS